MAQLNLFLALAAAAALLPTASALPRHIANLTALHPPPPASQHHLTALFRRQGVNFGPGQSHHIPDSPWLTQYPAWWPPYNAANCDPTQGPAHFLPMGCEERYACKLGAGLHDRLVAKKDFDRIWGDTWACNFFDNPEVRMKVEGVNSRATRINKQHERERKEGWRKKLKEEKRKKKEAERMKKEEEKEIKEALNGEKCVMLGMGYNVERGSMGNDALERRDQCGI